MEVFWARSARLFQFHHLVTKRASEKAAAGFLSGPAWFMRYRRGGFSSDRVQLRLVREKRSAGLQLTIEADRQTAVEAHGIACSPAVAILREARVVTRRVGARSQWRSFDGGVGRNSCECRHARPTCQRTQRRPEPAPSVRRGQFLR